jgi:hypothetical protein
MLPSVLKSRPKSPDNNNNNKNNHNTNNNNKNNNNNNKLKPQGNLKEYKEIQGNPQETRRKPLGNPGKPQTLKRKPRGNPQTLVGKPMSPALEPIII